MTIHEVAPLIQASLATGVLILVAAKGGFSRPFVRWFTLFIIGQMLWGLAVFGLRGSSDLDWALRWERLTPAAVSLTVISFYYFSRLMVRSPPPRWMAILASFHLVISIASIPTPFLVKGVEVVSYGNTVVWGNGLIPWTFPIYLMMSYSLATLYRGYRSAGSYTEKNRLLLLFIAASVSVVGSFLDVAPVLGLDVPPATSWANSLFFVLAGVAILRYQLLDIKTALQHRISYILRSSTNIVLLGIGISLSWWVGLPAWSIVLLSISIILMAEPIWRKVDISLRARLEKDLRGEIQTLLTLGTGHTGANTLQVADTVVKLLQRVIHPTHSTLLLLEDGEARPLVSQGYPIVPEVPLTETHPLIHYLKNQQIPVFHSDLMVEPHFQTMTTQNLEAISALNATVYVPLTSRETLEGLLAVGPKTRGSVYSWQEIEFLQALGQQSALLLESIRLSKADRVQREHMEHIREIQRSMVQARDEERRSLAAEIHDEPIQMLVGSLVRVNLIRECLLTRPEMSQQQLDHVVTNLLRAEKSLRRIMTGVFPSLLSDLGLLAALEALFQDLENSGTAKTNIHLSVKVKGIPSDWNPPLDVSLVIYRFIQEGLRNALGHSQASEVKVTAEYVDEAAIVEVVDNGQGIDTQRIASRRKEGHVGLLGLEERLGAIGGTMNLSNRAEGGASLTGEFPHQSPSPDPEALWSVEYDFIPLPIPESQTETSEKTPVHTPS